MREKAFLKFVRHVQAVVNAYTAEHFPNQPQTIKYTEGPSWWRVIVLQGRIEGELLAGRDEIGSVYCFVRKADGAIFKAKSSKSPDTKTGLRGYLDNYPDQLLGAYGITYLRGSSYGPSVYPPRPE